MKKNSKIYIVWIFYKYFCIFAEGRDSELVCEPKMFVFLEYKFLSKIRFLR